MPLRSNSNEVFPLGIPQGLDISPDTPDATVAEVFAAGFRKDNPVVSVAQATGQVDNSIDPNFNPWDALQGTGFEDQWANFAGTTNAQQFGRTMERVQQENEDNHILSEAGALGFGASFVASVLDPTNLLPGGVLVRGARGASVARTAANVGVAAGVATTASEAILQGSQLTRTAEESGFAIGGSVILGSALGAGVAALVNRSVYRAAAKQIETAPVQVAQDIAAIAESAGAAVPEKVVSGPVASRFHGTSMKIDQLYPDTYSTMNIYGQGFYTTDNLEIARGYTKKGRGGQPTVYDVFPKDNVGLFDMEAPLTSDIEKAARESFGDLYPTTMADTGEAPKNLREIYDEVRAQSRYEGLTAHDVQDMFDSMRLHLEDQGFRGLNHVGGLKTGKSPHDVKIYWNPHEDLQITERPIEVAPLPEAPDIQSVGAASAYHSDLSLRNEGRLQALRKIPILGLTTRSDPIIRGVLSPFNEVRRTWAELTATPLQWKVNEKGETLAPGGSVEARINVRRNAELSAAVNDLDRIFAQYWQGGPVGVVGTFKAPVEAWMANTLKATSKMTKDQFLDEVGLAMIHGDAHAIPEVAQAAQTLRNRIFSKAFDEAKALGMFDNIDEVPKNAKSYFTRVFNRRKITAHLDDGTENDIVPVLQKAFTESQMQKAAEAKKAGEPFDVMTEAEIKSKVLDAVGNIIGLAEGEHSIHAALSSPTRARVLDVADEALAPWLEHNAATVTEAYFHSLIPDMELIKHFGSVDLADRFTRIKEETLDRISKASGQRERTRLQQEHDARVADLAAVLQRIRGRYGVPRNPDSIWVRAGRTSKVVSYTGLLGGMLISAMPDIGSLIARNGFMRTFGDTLGDLATSPRRILKAKEDILDFGAAAEWVLDSRTAALSEITGPYRGGTVFERGLTAASRSFSRVTFMAPWNVLWKSIGGGIAMSRMLKAADAVSRGTASKKQMTQLAEAGIDKTLAVKIAKQAEMHGDKDGRLWFANASAWKDRNAFEAFRAAMSREMDLMVITPGQDKPLFMSTPIGSMLLQFKSFAVSANHRIMLAGIQRADQDVLIGALIAVALGGMVSDLKAWNGGYESKKGVNFYLDAMDRSGLLGWLFEANAVAELGGVGLKSLTGQRLSRFQSRSGLLGLLGPSVDMAANLANLSQAVVSGDLRQSDIHKVMKMVPFNNVFYLARLFDQMEEGVVSLTGAKPRRN